MTTLPSGFIVCQCGAQAGRPGDYCRKCGLVFGARIAVESDTAAPPKVKRVTRKLTGTEQRWLRDVAETYVGFRWYAQLLTLPLSDTETYRPDFFGVPQFDERLICIEVKGGHMGKVAWSREGIQKYRRACEAWSDWFDFALWHWNGTQWEKQDK